MKQKTLIIGGIIIILILLFVWVYLLFFSTPKDPSQVFTDLGIGGGEETGIVIPPEEDPIDTTVTNGLSKLRQLTTKPVAGFVEIPATNTIPAYVYYTEAGTGHIYKIDPMSGNEERVSNTTIAEASYASFSPSGNYVAIRSSNDKRSEDITVGKLDLETGSLVTESLSGQIEDFKIVNNSELLYSSREVSGLVGHSYNLNTKVKKDLFTVPFYEAVILWGSTGNSSHYVYPKSSYALEGFLYEVKDGTLNRLPLEGFGFSAKANSDMVLYNKISGDKASSYIYDRQANVSRPLDAVVVPEKCYLLKSGFEFVCPFENTTIPFRFPDEWYMGKMSFKDSLWRLDADSMTGEEMVDTFAESSREIDITGLDFYPDSSTFYFINKNDNTLWLYEI